ncbi:Rho-binding antiterminator [Oceanimonas baumannii]|uniref:Rho-binding antiterminator n=1 Tax=Oceanimonas baumannii TaxID=129578 RepID=UPI001D189161|nr:Rho-binding antiterminator [Oceanimonas baumannii]MCC4264303.1 Rho-binding antiterminator [Oceanimonas baumannii]
MMSCEQHDYLEIACLYHYEVRLTLTTGEYITGVALDTCRDENKVECLKLNTGQQVRLLPLPDLVSMTATGPNPHFARVDLTN